MAAVDYSHYDLSVPGFMSPEELEWLYQQACRMRSIVEIGSWKGRSAVALLNGLRDGLGGVLHCVDLWERWSPQRIARASVHDFMANVQTSAGRLPVMWPMASVEAASQFPGHVDMVFIDGSHDGLSVARDIDAWKSRAARLLCGHDFGHPDYPDVERVVRERFPDVERGPGYLWSLPV